MFLLTIIKYYIFTKKNKTKPYNSKIVQLIYQNGYFS